ncbi:MAG TPA: hypothetical protein VMT63_00540 [Bacteroidales bacterium]|nr:hypothetical protein [Bacteroidales bacterium]
MKKILTIVAFVMIAAAAKAQDYKTSLGIRAGLPYGATIKHFLDKTDALEGILASRWGGLVVTGLYEKESWTGHYPGLNWYWGAGAHVGFWSNSDNPNLTKNYSGGPVLGADGVLGLEYTFDQIPLNLAADLLPTVNLIGYTGWGGLNFAISIRYVF